MVTAFAKARNDYDSVAMDIIVVNEFIVVCDIIGVTALRGLIIVEVGE